MTELQSVMTEHHSVRVEVHKALSELIEAYWEVEGAIRSVSEVEGLDATLLRLLGRQPSLAEVMGELIEQLHELDSRRADLGVRMLKS